MSTSSKAADILLETGSCFKRIAEMTMELIDPNRLSGTTAAPKIPVDSSDLKRLRDTLNRFSSDLDNVSQRIQSNRESSAASQEVEKLLNPTGSTDQIQESMGNTNQLEESIDHVEQIQELNHNIDQVQETSATNESAMIDSSTSEDKPTSSVSTTE